MNNLTKNKWLLFLLGFLLLANITLLLSFYVFGERPAGRGDKGNRSPQPPITGFLSKELKMDVDQQAKLKSLKDERFKVIKPLWEEIRKTKDSLYHQLKDPAFSEEELNALTTRLSEKNKRSDELVFRYFQEVRKLCTPEQQVGFDTIVPQMLSRRDQWNKGPHKPNK
ncbi:Spy/CpxP family protein refolding chaperone [Pollutibacter soli]|uniref:Spy/CpxP family protein refolding chaperone n=1 Tax=Pollutibacter soli TaxID=3034157 RepID=UPI0030137A92